MLHDDRDIGDDHAGKVRIVGDGLGVFQVVEAQVKGAARRHLHPIRPYRLAFCEINRDLDVRVGVACVQNANRLVADELAGCARARGRNVPLGYRPDFVSDAFGHRVPPRKPNPNGLICGVVPASKRERVRKDRVRPNTGMRAHRLCRRQSDCEREMTVETYRPLRGQRAIVTGASSGIGRGIALAFGQAGADVLVNYASSAFGAEATAASLRDMGVRAFACRADVSNEAEVLAMFERARAEFGTIDILVANAGLQRDAPVGDMTLEDWNRVLSINLTGQFLCAREAVREFRRRGPLPAVSKATGKIICMSSVHQVIPWAGHVNYAASKGGIDLMMRSLAQEVAPEGIRVNGIAPGAIRTPINRDAWETEDAYKRLLTLIPYKRIGEPEDVAKAAVWLASDDSDYVVGTTLFVDGGMTLYPGFEDNG